MKGRAFSENEIRLFQKGRGYSDRLMQCLLHLSSHVGRPCKVKLQFSIFRKSNINRYHTNIFELFWKKSKKIPNLEFKKKIFFLLDFLVQK